MLATSGLFFNVAMVGLLAEAWVASKRRAP